ncbi:hypothetical protein [Plesiomonas sp.]|uniref:hypothetical protein n=1 Tax=Plesiomonas sp. TaxID=2486279 RepID=UPI003F371568
MHMTLNRILLPILLGFTLINSPLSVADSVSLGSDNFTAIPDDNPTMFNSGRVAFSGSVYQASCYISIGMENHVSTDEKIQPNAELITPNCISQLDDDKFLIEHDYFKLDIKNPVKNKANIIRYSHFSATVKNNLIDAGHVFKLKFIYN